MDMSMDDMFESLAVPPDELETNPLDIGSIETRVVDSVLYTILLQIWTRCRLLVLFI
jgi:hypothetical protein